MTKCTLILASQGERRQVRGSSLARMTVQRKCFFSPTDLKSSLKPPPYTAVILAEEKRHTDWCGMKPHLVPHRSSESWVGFCSSPAVTWRTTNWHFFPIWNSKQFTHLIGGGWAKWPSTYEPIRHTTQVLFVCVFAQFLHDRILVHDWSAYYIYSNINLWP